MKKVLATLVAMAVIFLASGVHAAYIETFSTDNANWNYGYGMNFVSPQLAAGWTSTGGNPTGHISGNANNLYAVWTYATAPYGDMTGLSLTIDTQATNATGNAQFYVGRGNTYFIDGSWGISYDTNWTTHVVALDSAHFTSWTGVNDYYYTLAQVLAAPTDIGIFFGGNLASGNGTLSLDNFGTTTVPEPATMLLLGFGLVGLAGVRRKYKK